jgi:glycosyltransferase involved in cell wall biosynthesis
MRVLVATDAWHPQVNGVVRSLEQTAVAAAQLGVRFSFLSPQGHPTLPMPTYPEIRLALISPRAVERRISEDAPDYIHIATEGPIGVLTRRACLRSGRAFTTSYHTRFPEYLSARAPIPEALSYRVLRGFHNAGSGTMVSTPALESDLRRRGFLHLMRWSRGVDRDLFRPDHAPLFDLPRPVFLYVGRVAVEKNVEAFLRLDLPGTKLVVGNGPALSALQAKYPAARFAGSLEGQELARAYASADVFVFPSLTDTFGIVLLEALASGLPVAAFPVTGPIDVIGGTGAGVIDWDLRAASLACLAIGSDSCIEVAERYSWAEAARQFMSNLEIASCRLPGVPA